jgi:hypothetical protein
MKITGLRYVPCLRLCPDQIMPSDLNRIEAYAASLLEDAVHVPDGATRLDEDRFESTLREMAQFSQKIPSLPDEAFTRESLYQDHD